MGGDGKKAGGTDQWLPYWTNGNVPLVELIKAAGPQAIARLDPELGLVDILETWMEYVMVGGSDPHALTASRMHTL